VCARRIEESSRFRAWWFLLVIALPVCAQAQQHFLSAQESVEKVLTLVDERMALMPAVAAWKWQNQTLIADPERERIVAARAGEAARAMGLAPEGVQAFFEVQIRAARETQAALHERWRTGGFSFPTPIPSLAGDIRPQLDRLTVELLRAVNLAGAELERTDFVSAYGALVARLLNTEGWTDGGRRDVLIALSGIRRSPSAQSSGSIPALQRIAAAGVLRIGTTGDYAPFSIERSGALSGADIDLGEGLARRLKVTPVFVRTTWPTLLDDLRAGRFDVALGGISVTPERAAVATLSLPYSSGGKTIVSRCADARRYRKLKAVDRNGVRVIVNPGGTNEQYVRANVHHAQVIVFPDNRAIFDEIRAGRADVMITDDVEVELQTRAHSDLCRTLPGTLTHADKAVLMPRDEALVAAVNAWLAESIKSGEPARLLQQHLSP
jgi:cyclohexadienyl dehydratase